MTTDQLTAIRREVEAAMALREQATPGPWLISAMRDFVPEGYDLLAHMCGQDIYAKNPGDTCAGLDQKFIAHARTDPTHDNALALLAEVERLNDELAKMKGGA